MTFEEYVAGTNHQCNAVCQGRATHAEIGYTDAIYAPDKIKRDLEYMVGHMFRIDYVRLAPEAETRIVRKERVKYKTFGGPEPEVGECQVAWLIVMTLWDEING